MRVNVDVDLHDIPEGELVIELIHRGYSVAKMKRNLNSLEEIMELFKTKNPKACLADTIELENHMREIVYRI